MRNPDPYGRIFDSERPLRIAPIACSRTPKCRLRPAGESAWRSPAPGAVIAVFVEGVRSAEPPTSHGTSPAIVFNTRDDAAAFCCLRPLTFEPPYT